MQNIRRVQNLMGFEIEDKFHKYRQSEMDELVQEYIFDLAEENKCSVLDLPRVYNLEVFRYMIFRFGTEVQKVWDEQINN